ncbi:MAG: hypothetical protein HQL45_14335 [Alphaproteobacteria bacterium]|nr:hypothetical protein [Alphaproteobacteria bacterium]
MSNQSMDTLHALTNDNMDTLRALMVALDEVSGIWGAIEEALIEQGIDNPETAFEALRKAAFEEGS